MYSAEALVHRLKSNNYIVTTAEACTGGLIAGAITDIGFIEDPVCLGCIVAKLNPLDTFFSPVPPIVATTYPVLLSIITIAA